MRNWQNTILAVFTGIAATVVLFLVAGPPRGKAVDLLPAPTLAPLIVHVDGAVVHPGLYELPHGSRVSDAVQAAGGLTKAADQDAVNLAAAVKDGGKIIIPVEGAPPPPVITGESPGNDDSDPAAGLPGSPVNLNSASLDELLTLPGIGETKAEDIIRYREAHGGFKTIEEIQEVKGIGPATFESLRDLITVD